MDRVLRSLLQAVLASALAASAAAQSDITRYVSLGDSLAAGFSSNALVETNQASSVPALIARQAGISGFQQPLVAEPGIPPQLTLFRLLPSVVIGPKASSPGAPKNLTLPRPYDNLAVPGAIALDALTRVSDGGGFHDLILRGLGTQVSQALALRPTFITLWIGNNDVLGAAIRGRAIDGVTLTPPPAFRQIYGGLIVALKASGAGIVAANLPDVTAIPFVTTVKPYVVNPATGAPVLVNGQTVPLIGPGGPLPPSAYVTLAASSLLAQGIGIPAALGGTGLPLPDEVVLDAQEVAVIREHVAQDNQAIREIAQQAGVGVLDVHGLLDELARQGRTVGGVHVTSAFLTGGFFSYDGVHPSALGYAITANEWIAAINAAGGRLGPVDLAPFLGLTSLSLDARGRPTPPFVFTAEAYAELLKAFPTVDRN